MSGFSDAAKKIIATVAPMLGTAFGGPLGTAAGVFIANKLGGGDPKVAEQAVLSGDPDTLLKLKEADNEFTEQMAKLGVDMETLRLQDVANARAREIAVRDNTPKVQSYLTTAGFFAALIGAFMMDIPDGSKAIVFSMIGSLGTVWISQQGYYFGSSSGSAAKTDALNKIATSKS
jgi:hypothetical protein